MQGHSSTHRFEEPLPADIRTLLRHFDLDPEVNAYVCCPQCFCLYDTAGPCPDHCTHTTFRGPPVCNTPLFETRFLKGGAHKMAIRKYIQQDLKAWHGRLLARKDVELALAQTAKSAKKVPRHQLSRVVHDIMESNIVQDFTGPDGVRFVDCPDSELRFVWGLGFDGFNPYNPRPGGPNASSSAIYLVLMNLPPDMRFLEENMFLVGVIPGPEKVPMSAINHFTELIVAVLLRFWAPGVYFSKTTLFPNGRFTLGALLPLICDLVAAREITGFPGHSSTYFCSICRVRSDDIECLHTGMWERRTREQYIQEADVWLTLQTDADRTSHVSQGKVRWTPFVRLPYWDPVHFTVLESMHAHYLSNVRHHIFDAWGMDATSPSGDGVFWHAKKAPTCEVKDDPEKWQKVLRLLETSTQEELARLPSKYGGHATLWHLCYERDLRRAGTKQMLAARLISWV